MSTQSDIAAIRAIMTKLDANKASKFSYTDAAFNDDVVDGVSAFDVNAEQNIPLEGYTNFNDTVRGKGVRTQGASLPRMGINHFFGRMSYNLNKLIQKFSAWMDIDIAARAYNAAEYDPNAPYKTGGICYAVETKNGVKTITYYTRTSTTPDTITGIPVTNQNHWSEVIDKKSGVHHKYVIADLTTGYDVNTWYPVTTKLADFDAQVSGSKDPAMRQVIEVFYNGAVQGRANATRGELLVSTKFTGLAASTDTIVYDRSYTDTVAAVTADDTTIGYSTLPLGKQAVVWLRGGTSYALWNSFASEFTIHTSAYANGLDTSISPSASQVWNVLSSNLDVSVRRLANATPGSRGIDYLKASTVTTIAALILADLKTVDGTGSGLDADLVRGVTPGAGGLAALSKSATIWASDNGGASSGLDADMLDGFHASALTFCAQRGNSVSLIDARSEGYKLPNAYNKGIHFEFNDYFNIMPPDQAGYAFVITAVPWSDTSGGPSFQFAVTRAGNYYTRLSSGETAWGAWGKVWTQLNQGVGSGLDADLWHGLSPSEGSAGIEGSWTLSPGQTLVIPKGLYHCMPQNSDFALSVTISRAARTATYYGGLIYSDGTNYTITNQSSVQNGIVYYRKFA